MLAINQLESQKSEKTLLQWAQKTGTIKRAKWPR